MVIVFLYCYGFYIFFSFFFLFFIPFFFFWTCNSSRRSIVTDEYLRVKGSNGAIFAMGDAATVDQPRAITRAKASDLAFRQPMSLHCWRMQQ